MGDTVTYTLLKHKCEKKDKDEGYHLEFKEFYIESVNSPYKPLERYEYIESNKIANHLILSNEVYDAYDNKTIYQYKDQQRLSAITKYAGAKMYSEEVYFWTAKEGNL